MHIVGIKKLGKPMQYFQAPESANNPQGLTSDINMAWRFDTFMGAMRIAKGYKDSCVLTGNWS